MLLAPTTGRLLIDGRPRIVLCSSVFYFRIPASRWRRRLEQVRDSGYTAIETYVPWNLHERRPGEFDFAGDHDVAAFCDLAHDLGLLVVIRPGPYICSEWDGGALPAWLGCRDDIGLRQNEPRFLAAVGRWFDQILPLVAERQSHRGGSVVAVQLENELDFFDCADREGYLGALRDMAEEHGIEVPLLACAGQGDLAGAGGDVDRVVPTCNFYPADTSVELERDLLAYDATLRKRGLPLLVTETNRAHLTLRRMLACGARLLAPYLQTSGWNFGLTPSIGNWGDPGSLMSHGYHFAGYLDPTGVPRPEYDEAQILSRVIATFGEALAAGTPQASRVQIEADFTTARQPAEIALDGGGALVAIPNLESAGMGSARLSLPEGTVVDAVVPGGQCPLLPYDLPLARWGVPGRLRWAAAELVAVEQNADTGGTLLQFSSDVPFEVAIELGADWMMTGGGDEAKPCHQMLLDPADPARDRATFLAPTGASLTLVGARRDRRTLRPDRRSEPVPTAQAARISAQDADLFGAVRPAHGPARPLEAHQVYRGRGRYRAAVSGSALLLRGAADLVDVVIADRPLSTITRYGSPVWLALDSAEPVEVSISTEIWGHPNFDDVRRPSLRLGSSRGLGDPISVAQVMPVASHWEVSGDDQWASADRPPLRDLGGWSSTRIGRPIGYRRGITLPANGDVHLLHLDGLDTNVSVTLDGGDPIAVGPGDPLVDLGPSGCVNVLVEAVHDPDRRLGAARVVSGSPVSEWEFRGLTEEALTAQAAAVTASASGVELPLNARGGRPQWLSVELPAAAELGADVYLLPRGTGCRLTGWLGEHCLGRVWLPGPERPIFTGGPSDRFWLPSEWVGADRVVTLLVEATAGEQPGQLLALEFCPVDSTSS